MDFCCIFCCNETSSRLSKYIYGIIYFISIIVTWLVRDRAGSHLEKLKEYDICNGVNDCVGAQGVLRISFALFLFFTVMFFSTLGTKYTNDWRDKWHSGFWSLKLFLLSILLVSSFLIPSGFFRIYTDISRVGSVIFLLIVLISTINFIFASNDYLLAVTNRRGLAVIIPASICSCLFTLAAIISMYVFFSPDPFCKLNIFFITFILFISILLISTSFLKKAENATLYTSGLMCAYLVFLVFSAIMSEPVTYTCNTLPRQTGRNDWITIFSFFLALIGIIITTYFTSLDSNVFRFITLEAKEGEVPYGYGFFHFVFALGSMYMSMLFVGWNLNTTQKQWSMDGGWTSVWMKMSVAWAAALLYLWIVLAPVFFPSRFT